MRRVVSPSGEPLLAVAELPLRFLVRLLSEVGQRPGLQIAIESPDDHALVTTPSDDTSARRDQKSILAHPPEVPFALRAERHEGPTIGIVKPTDYTGVRILLTLDEPLALSAWTRQQGRVMGAVGIACLMILGFAVALTAVLRQREKVASERDQARTILENAIEAMADGFVIWDENDRLVTCNARYRELYARIAPIMKARRELSGCFALRRADRAVPGSRRAGRTVPRSHHGVASQRWWGSRAQSSRRHVAAHHRPAHGGWLCGRHAHRHHGRQGGAKRARGSPRPGQGRDDRAASSRTSS